MEHTSIMTHYKISVSLLKAHASDNTKVELNEANPGVSVNHNVGNIRPYQDSPVLSFVVSLRNLREHNLHQKCFTCC